MQDEKDPDGKPTGRQAQARDRQTGMPVWSVRVMHRGGSGMGDFIKVSVPAATQPELDVNDPVEFDGLTIGAYVGNDKRPGLFFHASAVRPARVA